MDLDEQFIKEAQDRLNKAIEEKQLEIKAAKKMLYHYDKLAESLRVLTGEATETE